MGVATLRRHREAIAKAAAEPTEKQVIIVPDGTFSPRKESSGFRTDHLAAEQLAASKKAAEDSMDE